MSDSEDDNLVSEQLNNDHEGKPMQKRPPDISSGWQCFKVWQAICPFFDAASGLVIR